MRKLIAAGVLGGCLAACTGDTQTVTVYEAGPVVTQCSEPTVTLEQSAARLDAANVEILRSSCGVMKGMMFPSVCGAATGQILLHDVRGSSLATAKSMGFSNAADLPEDADSGSGWERSRCP